MARILIAGSLAFDRIMTFSGRFKDHFLPDKLHQISVSFFIDRVVEEFGGTAGNIGYNLALLYVSPHLVANAGTDFDKYDEYLTGLGIDTSTIGRIPDVQTASAYIMTDLSDNQITAFTPGACAEAYAGTALVAGAHLLHVSPTSDEDMLVLPEKARTAGVPYFFDPGQRMTSLPVETLRAGIEGADVLFVNDYELALAIERTGWNEAQIVERVRLLVVTLGAEGSRLVTREGESLIPSVPAKAVDPTGAGDAYRAGFIAGYVAGLPDSTSAKIASTIAACTVETRGTQSHSPSRDDLKARYEGAYSGETWPL
ncbi:MAG: adenosine kinase [Parcubacteria bacterium C7867-004]|nr:MAG: adenosine kinase [Parcubacteria bacterium C7867-004]